MPRMRYLSAVIAAFLLSVTAFAQEPSGAEVFREGVAGRFVGGQHFIVEPQHVLSAEERADLAEHGLRIVRPLASGQYLAVRLANSTVDATDLRIRSLSPITPEQKLTASALHEGAAGRAFARVRVSFHDEVSLDQARAAIEAAGGELERPFTTDFELPRRLRARVPAGSLTQLASDERVYMINGPAPRAANDNLAAAQASRVDIVQASPYNLSGSGVVISEFELAPADATHPEFGGRLFVHYPAGASTADADHATHTAGTMIASGATGNPNSANAKGMAPAATLHEYDACDACDWLGDKDTKVPAVGSVADNNSWGYILGWCQSRCDASTGWLWTGNDEYIGGYDGEINAAIDQITRAHGTIFVHSAGNEGGNTGPFSEWAEHNHINDTGDTLPEIFCYSKNGSGTDCPAIQCAAGPAHCEVTKHPTHGTIGSIGLTASSKNVIAVGATDSGKNVAGFSSRGPTRDGRVKPDVTAKGTSTLSTTPNANYARMSGTSMAAPVVTGIAALLTQQYKQIFNSAIPTPITLKGLIIAGAEDRGNPGPDFFYGFGHADAKASVDLIRDDAGTGKRFALRSIANGESFDFPITVASAQKLRVVVSWLDPEIPITDPTKPTLVNDLDLVVKDPSGNTLLPYVLDKNNPGANATTGVNTVDNTEEVETNAVAGTYHAIVKGTRVMSASPQQFIVIANGTLGTPAAPCTDPTEPNNSAATAFGFIGSGQTVNARLCETSDVDFFKVHVDKSGPLTITVKTKDAPVLVTLIPPVGAPQTTNVAASSTGTITTQVGSVPADYIVSVALTGTSLGNDSSYTLSPTFTSSAPGRVRTVKR
jgi:hypothetical protein